MTLEEIVDMYGFSIGTHLVSRRVVKNIEGPFKGFKTYCIELWDAGAQEKIIQAETAGHITDNNKESIIKEVEKDFIKMMFAHYALK